MVKGNLVVHNINYNLKYYLIGMSTKFFIILPALALNHLL